MASFRLKKLPFVCIIFIAILAGFSYNHAYFIKGTDVPMRIHDNLEQAPIARTHIYKESNFFWRNGQASERLMDGNYFEPKGPRLIWKNVAYYYLDAFHAFLITDTLARILAFLGMFLWLRSLFVKNNGSMAVVFSISLLYTFLPFYHPHILTIALLPVIAWLFTVFHKEEGRFWHWVVLCLLPFFTSYFFAPFFLMVIVLLVYVFQFSKSKILHKQFLWAFLIFNLLYLVTEYRFFYVAMFSNEVTHRVVREEVSFGLSSAMRMAFSNFEFGNHHVPTLHRSNYVIALFFLAAQYIYFYSKESAGVFLKKNRGVVTNAFLVINLIALISFLYGIADWVVFKNIHESIPLVKMVNIRRFHWMHPMLWYTFFAFMVYIIFTILKLKSIRHAYIFLTLFTILQLRILIMNAPWSERESITHGNASYRNLPSFEQFFARDQFKEIKTFIGAPLESYRVVSLGMHPSIALYNGFYCLDGYRSNYFHSYHQEFREIIAPSLELNEEMRVYFDNRGNRCYLIDDELTQSFLHWRNHEFTDTQIEDLTINFDKLYDMGGRYIISAVEIMNPGDWLQLLRVFDKDPPEKTNWTIFLYKVLPLHLPQ